MFLSYFTEQPMAAYPEDEGLRAGFTSVLFSNKFFDPVEGSRLYRERLDEYRLVEEVGFDGIMVNEHHNAPFCMQPRITVWSSILAAITERVKIVQLGNPLPTYDSPLQFAEEIAMIDMISQGRLVSGIVRGAGQESVCLNSNPAYNRERFDEAHNLLVKAMTDDGPFTWEGEHFQYRVVNPWVRVLQRAGLILSPEHHAIHHAAPQDKYYCITVGWMNPVLEKVRFFRILEAIVGRLAPGALRPDLRA